jgi:hypothetical protein
MSGNAKRMTRAFKETQCGNCKHANKAKLRQGRQHCPFVNPERRNGHCVPFEPMTRKRTKED